MLEKNEKHGLLFYMKELTLVIVLFVLLLLFYCFAPKFMTIENIKNILVQNAYIIVSSIGMAFVIIGGGIDLSVGYQISLVGVITTISIQWFHLPVWCSVLIGLMIGTLLGAINGFLSVKLQVHPMVITLATMAIYQGISYIITNSNSIYGLPDSFKFIGQGKILGIPVSIIITVIVLIGATFFLSKTYPGRYIYALGGNGEAARLSGVNTSAMRVISFAICGFFVAVASILLVSRSGSMNSSVGAGTEFTCITAAVLGGVSMAGGEGKVWKVCVGAIILGVLSNGMQFVGIGVYPQYVAKGIILMAAIVGAIGAVVGSGGAANESQDGTYQAQVSGKTESFRELVSEYCEKYGIDDYVDLCLAVIEQESGGTEPDVMQTAQSYYNVNPPIDSAEESIDCGTHELSDCLTKAKCQSPNDIKGISLALQGYNLWLLHQRKCRDLFCEDVCRTWVQFLW